MQISKKKKRFLIIFLDNLKDKIKKGKQHVKKIITFNTSKKELILAISVTIIFTF